MDNNVSEEFAETSFRVLGEKYAARQKKMLEEQNSGWSSRPMGLSLTCKMGGARGGTDKKMIKKK
jgi:hypothetical protein